MKTIEIQNPTRLLSAIGEQVKAEYVRTCRSDTCCCASHDSGYDIVTMTVPDWLVTKTGGGSVHCHANTRVLLDESYAAAKAAGEQRSREAGLINIALTKRADEEKATAIAAAKLRRERYEATKAKALTAWAEAGLDAPALWKRKLQWSHEAAVIELAARLVKMRPFGANGHRSFEAGGGFKSPLSYPRTEVAMQMAWGEIPPVADWKATAARLGVGVY